MTDVPTAVAAHPVAWGIGSGLLMALIGLLLFEVLWLAGLVGGVFGFLNWFVWRPTGPAHRWRQDILRRFPPK